MQRKELYYIYNSICCSYSDLGREWRRLRFQVSSRSISVLVIVDVLSLHERPHPPDTNNKQTMAQTRPCREPGYIKKRGPHHLPHLQYVVLRDTAYYPRLVLVPSEV